MNTPSCSNPNTTSPDTTSPNTTSPDELLDVLDANGAQLHTASRTQVHQQGLWHGVFHCQIIAVRNGVPKMVLQRRHASKLAFGGLLDVSAAGHLAAGETPSDGRRELTEELGISVDACELTPLGIRRLVDTQGEGQMNKEFTHIYLLRDDRPMSDYQLAHGEVDAVFEGATTDLLALFANQTDAVDLVGCSATGEQLAKRFTLADFVPDLDYWIALTVMSERFGLGVKPIAI